MAERLNTLGAEHWELFSQQNYFDKRGVFFCTLVSGPLVLILLVVLVSGGAAAGHASEVEQRGDRTGVAQRHVACVRAGQR